MPRVSIITPVLNGVRYLPQMLASVEAQRGSFEHVIVDGGSTDGTLELVREHCARNSWARYMSGRDSGQSEAINRGAELCQGEYLAWLNADDFYLGGALEAVEETIRRRPDVGLIYGGAHIVSECGALVYCAEAEPFDRSVLLRRRNLIAQPAAFVKTNLFRCALGVKRSLHYAMDYDLWLRVSELAPAVAISSPLAAFRLHRSSKTCSRQWRFHLEQSRIAIEHGAGVASPIVLNSLRYVLKEPARRLALRWGWCDGFVSYKPRLS